jgi:hypothetical protein
VRFYLGTHIKSWLWRGDTEDLGPLFVSWVRMRRRKTPFTQRARIPWALDSGGFSEIAMHGRWTREEAEYLDAIEQYVEEVGSLEWAAQMDWMCEPPMVAKSGLSVLEHQHRTVENYCRLRTAAPHLPIAPVLQGWDLDDYPRSVALFEAAGVDLRACPVVGVGSVCRRQASSEIERLFQSLSAYGLRLHGFGVKTAGVARYGQHLHSADSMAWCAAARRHDGAWCGGPHLNCSNCPEWARVWRRAVLDRVPGDESPS